MKLKNTAFAYNVTVNGSSNCDWGTDLGQGRKHTFTLEGFPEVLNAMVYYKIDDVENIKVILGKGNRISKKFSEYEGIQLVLASCFNKIYLNDIYLDGQRLVMYILKDVTEKNSKGQSNVHLNRCTLKFSNSLLYNNEPVNQKCIDAITNAFGLSDEGSWAVLEMVISNEDELHLYGFPIDNVPKDYSSIEERNSDFEKRVHEHAKAKRREAFKNYLFAPNTFKTEGAAKNYWKHIDEPFYKERLSFVWDKLSELLGFESDDLFEIDNPEDATKLYDMVQPLQENKDYGNQLASAILKKYIDFLKDKSSKKTTSDKGTYIIPSDFPLQQIFYGAPGTGKSHETNRVTRVYRDTIRTTFHPDSDYSTFVGSYKPTTTKEPVFGLNGTTTIQLTDPSTRKPLETTKIVYKFIKQAFLKAYILAWKKMCAATTTSTSSTTTLHPSIICTKPLTFKKGLATYTILTMDDSRVSFKKEEPFERSAVENVWPNLWSSGSFKIPNVPRSGATFQEAVSQWICDWKGADTTKNDFEQGWNEIISRLKAGQQIKVKNNNGNKKYFLSYNGNDDSVKKTSEDNATKNAIEKAYIGDTSQNASAKGIADILHNYSSDFKEAWEQLKTVLLNGGQQTTNPAETIAIQPQFLVIEEINRGNCAQIFGDIFQLLDRKGGYSEYPIEADEDIKKALLEDNPADGLSFGSTGLQLSDEIKEELKTLYNDSVDDIVSKICKGDVLVLPKNLYIWATMNTSDQSLFPIDSAFKRRWDWTYMPIKEAKDKNYKIVLSGSNIEYNWWDFISAINNVINEVTSSEDKKLGYFFCKPCDDKNITASQFVNKVIFYLWNDVLKDYEMPKEFEYGETKKEDTSKSNHMSFNDFYTDQEKCIRQLMENLGVKPITEVVKTEPTTDDASTAATSELVTDDTTASTAAIGTDESTEQTLF